MTSNFIKLEKLDCGNFIRCQTMQFLLATLKVVHVLNTPKSMDKDNKTVAETRERQNWENDE